MTRLAYGATRTMKITDLDDDLDLDDRNSIDYGAATTLSGTSTPPANGNEEDVDRVAEIIGRTGGAANHPDGPGVGGD